MPLEIKENSIQPINTDTQPSVVDVDVPIMDSEEAVYKDIAEDDYKNEEIICLDDDSDELGGTGMSAEELLPTEPLTDPLSATTSNAPPYGLSEKRKLGSDSLSPHKRQCLGVENP